MSKLDALFERFLHENTHLKNLAPTTVDYYRQVWWAYKRYAGSEEINESLLNLFVIELRKAGRRPVSCNTYITGMNVFCNWLFKNKHLPARLRLSKLKVGERRRKTISEVDLRKIIQHHPRNLVERRLQMVLLVLIDTGVRIDEALSLRRNSIDFASRLIRIVGKGQKERFVPISLQLASLLSEYLQQHEFDLVFCSNRGEKVSYDNLRRDFLKLCDLLEIERNGSFHTFRHTFAYSYAAAFGKLSGDSKNSLFHLQKQLGHSDLSTTRIYVDLQPQDLVEVHDKVSLLAKLCSNAKDD